MVNRNGASEKLGAAAQLDIVSPQAIQASGVKRDGGIIGSSRILSEGSGGFFNSAVSFLHGFDTDSGRSFAPRPQAAQTGEIRGARGFISQSLAASLSQAERIVDENRQGDDGNSEEHARNGEPEPASRETGLSHFGKNVLEGQSRAIPDRYPPVP